MKLKVWDIGQDIRDLRYGIRNLWRWLPLIWKDRDWDWEYLSTIMKFKIGNMADSIEEYGNLERTDRTVAELRELAALLDRLGGALYEGGMSDWVDQSFIHASLEEQRLMYRIVEGRNKLTSYRFGNRMSNIEWWWD
jgi:hypothetical protein